MIYIKTTEAEKEEPGNGEEQQGGENIPQEEQVPPTDVGASMGGGEIHNSDPVATGGGSTNPSVPRVIVTGFRTDPQVVNAGSNFRLTVQIKNTSASTAVSNMLFDLQAPSAGTEARQRRRPFFRHRDPVLFIWTAFRQRNPRNFH